MRLYYGWIIVAIGFVVWVLAVGTTINAFGLFVLPVSEAFSLSRANVNTGVILLNLGVAVASPIVGRILDQFPARRIMIGGAFLYSASMIALGLSTNIWLSAFVVAVPLALGIAASGTLTSIALVTRWFTANRGRAIAITMMGMSLGTVVAVPAVGVLIDTFGWRQCLVVLGCAIAATFVVIIPFVREKPGPAEIEPGSSGEAADEAAASEAPVSDTPLTTSQLLRKPPFWVMTLGAALALGTLQTNIVSLVPLAQENGLSVNQSASLLSILGAMAFIGKLGLAWLGERLDRVLLLSGLFVVVALTSAALLVDHSYAALLASSAFLGLGAGAITPAFLALLADRFGPASFGTANGVSFFIIAIIGAASIRFGGEIYDRTGDYEAMFLTFIVMALLSAFLMFTIRPPARAPGGAKADATG